MLSIKQFHSYQKRAFMHILQHKRCGLFLDMGLGKTVITLSALRCLELQGEISKVLIIAPLRVAQNTWEAEAEKWDYTQQITITKVLGSASERKEALTKDTTYYVINRENVQWLVEYLGKAWDFDTVVIDELSSFKNPQAKRFKALKKVLPLTNRFIGLTGTPAPNSLLDLWSQVYLIDFGERLGKTITEYRYNYFRPGRRNAHIIYEWLPLQGTAQTVSRKLLDICLSMQASDYLQLPELMYNDITVTLSEETMERYKAFEREMVLSLDYKEITSDNAAVLINQLRQFTSGAIYTDGKEYEELHNEKLDTLIEICDVATSPILIAYEFQHDLSRIKKAIPKARVLNTPQDVQDWNEGKIQVAFGHPASIGHGINLQQGGHTIIWYTLTWSLELYQQYNARLHRQGQEQRVMIHHLIAGGTVDEQVRNSLKRKDKGQSSLLTMVKELRASYEQVIPTR